MKGVITKLFGFLKTLVYQWYTKHFDFHWYSWGPNFTNMRAIDPRETQKPSLESKEYSPKSFSPGVHMKISTLEIPLFCAWCPYIKNDHMKILNLFTKLIKQSFDHNDHPYIPQNWLTELNFQIHSKSTSFQGKIWYKMWVNSSIFSIPLKISPRESSEDATQKTKRAGPKHQIFQNFRVQNLVCTQKAHNLPTMCEMDNLLCWNTPNIGGIWWTPGENLINPFKNVSSIRISSIIAPHWIMVKKYCLEVVGVYIYTPTLYHQ